MICPTCGSENDAVTRISSDESGPFTGHVGICAYCGHVGVFTGDGLDLREPTDDERERMRGDPRIAEQLAMVQLRARIRESDL